MKLKSYLLPIVGAALAVASPALAQRGNGHGNGHANGRATDSVIGSLLGTQRDGSQGSVHASARAHERANENSAVRSGGNYIVRDRTNRSRTRYSNQRRPLSASANARLNSQGSVYASSRARTNANARSAVLTRSVPRKSR